MPPGATAPDLPNDSAMRDRGSPLGLLAVLGYKRVLFDSADTGSILTLEGEIDMPTGNRTQKLGSRPPGKMRYTCATLAAG
ncbi:MAG: hypothetical protein AUH28_01040 [Acidobacteria bacterium 13_1_40CM_56_16]|nr:MAG: hypothetical protein AUH28_01040 [Acidobacteria bacterium 13_1_40CM_56_16]